MQTGVFWASTVIVSLLTEMQNCFFPESNGGVSGTQADGSTARGLHASKKIQPPPPKMRDSYHRLLVKMHQKRTQNTFLRLTDNVCKRGVHQCCTICAKRNLLESSGIMWMGWDLLDVWAPHCVIHKWRTEQADERAVTHPSHSCVIL